MQILRTPEERFAGLKDYAFTPNYLYVDDTEGSVLRIHFLDEGPKDGRVVLLMHGQPSWSYLYRHMIPPLVDAGFRVIAPDLVGFGKSDKPTRETDYTYARHVAWMSDWLQQMKLSEITTFLQDWGSMIGLRLVAAFPDMFARVVLSNGGLPTGAVSNEYAKPLQELYQSMPIIKASELNEKFSEKGPQGFLYWRKFAAESDEIVRPSSVMDAIGAARPLSEDEKKGFDAPYPDEAYIAGVRRFPSLAPIFSDDDQAKENREAWQVLEKFDKPFLLAFANDDPVSAPLEAPFRERVAGCRGMEHRTIAPAGHFLQQDQPEQCVQAVLDITKLA